MTTMHQSDHVQHVQYVRVDGIPRHKDRCKILIITGSITALSMKYVAFTYLDAR